MRILKNYFLPGLLSLIIASLPSGCKKDEAVPLIGNWLNIG
jgi:hypothetical protein